MRAEHTCADVWESLQLFADGEADDAMCGDAAAHLESCPECRAAVEEEQHVKELLRRSCPCESAPDGLRDQVLARISTITVTQESSQILYTDGVSVTYVETHTTTVETWEG